MHHQKAHESHKSKKQIRKHRIELLKKKIRTGHYRVDEVQLIKALLLI